MEYQEKLLSVPEVAERLGLTSSCIRRWVLERRIEFVKVGAAVRFKPETIERYIAEHTVSAA